MVSFSRVANVWPLDKQQLAGFGQWWAKCLLLGYVPRFGEQLVGDWLRFIIEFCINLILSNLEGIERIFVL